VAGTTDRTGTYPNSGTSNFHSGKVTTHTLHFLIHRRRLRISQVNFTRRLQQHCPSTNIIFRWIFCDRQAKRPLAISKATELQFWFVVLVWREKKYDVLKIESGEDSFESCPTHRRPITWFEKQQLIPKRKHDKNKHTFSYIPR
jgi:hypothetical protein